MEQQRADVDVTPRRPAAWNEGSRADNQNAARGDVEPQSIGPVEKLVLGMTPADDVPVVPAILRSVLRAGDTEAQLAPVRSFLARHEGLRTEIAGDLVKQWDQVKGDRAAYTAAVSEARAQLLTYAKLANFAEAAPVAITDTLNELARYLTSSRGASGPG
jgi:hypothetical protein